MSYDRDEYMRRQEADHDLIRMRQPMPRKAPPMTTHDNLKTRRLEMVENIKATDMTPKEADKATVRLLRLDLAKRAAKKQRSINQSKRGRPEDKERQLIAVKYLRYLVTGDYAAAGLAKLELGK